MSQEPSQRSAFSAQLSEHDSFYGYNSGYWLYNETECDYRTSHLIFLGSTSTYAFDAELAARYAEFKADALQRVAANAVGAERCMTMGMCRDSIL
jgi:hypothetical protein